MIASDASIAIEYARDPVALCESVAVTVNELEPPAVGVPEMAPVDEFNVNPAGREPDVTAQVYEPDPPVADNVCEYAAPSEPAGSDVGEILSAAALIKIESCLVAETDAASTTLTVNVAFPLDVGVPAMTPSGASSTPAGNEPDSTDHVYGSDPPLADNVCEYAVPTVPDSKLDVLTPRGVPADTGIAIEDASTVMIANAANIRCRIPIAVDRVGARNSSITATSVLARLRGWCE